MPCRSEISARDTGPCCACNARSSMAVTAYRPFVVSRMACTTEVRNEDEYAIPEYLSQLLDLVKQSGIPAKLRPHHSKYRGALTRPFSGCRPGCWQRALKPDSALAGSHVALVLDAIEHFVAQGWQLLGAVVTAQALERAAHVFQSRIDRLKVIEQLADCPGDRVRHVLADAISIETELFSHGLALGFCLFIGLDDDAPRNTHHRGTGRHSLGHHRVGTDLGARPDRKRPQHLGTSTHHYTRLQGWMALAFVPAGATQGHALVKRHVVADFSGFANDDAHAVINEETPTYLGTRVNLDACHPAAEVRDNARRPLPAFVPQGMAQSMQPDRVQARVTGQDFKDIARSRITMEHTLNIFSQTIEHH